MALDRLGLEPLTLEPKEGLALINGTQGMLAVGVLACHRARALAKAADIAAAMTVEAILGTDRPFDERIHAAPPPPGPGASASNLRRLLAGSAIVASHRESAHLVQDAYSLRCAPQVHGAFRDMLEHAEGVLEIEIGSVSDNPIVFADDGEVLSGGNFHGQPVSVAHGRGGRWPRSGWRRSPSAASTGCSTRRRTTACPRSWSNGPGVNSGFMIVQYTAASLVSESKSLAHPASVDSIPSSAGQEDHVSMGMIAARHARDVRRNAEIVVALEALSAAQALDLRAPLSPARHRGRTGGDPAGGAVPRGGPRV